MAYSPATTGAAMPGAFIVFEGGEGAGKSTALMAVAERLRAEGHEVVTCREPGGTPAGEAVRVLLQQEMTPWAETFAFMVARAEIVAKVIKPALNRGAIVLCDRFEGSTFAYQGYGRGLGLDGLRVANSVATAGAMPDLVLWLDIDPQSGLLRTHGEEEARIRTGDEALAFHERVREGYRAQSKDPRWRRIDASQPAGEVAKAAGDAVTDFLYRTPRRV
jgi:dTMP kinase